MLVVAIHDIKKPKEFWEAASTLPIPEGMKLHTVYPSDNGTRGVCLWEGNSVADVQKLVDGAAGDMAQQSYYAVDDDNAMGLPS